MTTTHVVVGVLGVVLGVTGGSYVGSRRLRSLRVAPGPRRVLFPFAGRALSRRALDAALRIAKADNATLVPVFLARVPMGLPLNAPLPRQCAEGLPLLETIEQRAATLGVPVDSRVARGRTLRHAVREAIADERFERVVIAAASSRSEGFRPDDVAWLLDHAPGELVIVRPDGDDAIGTPSEPRAARLRANRRRTGRMRQGGRLRAPSSAASLYHAAGAREVYR